METSPRSMPGASPRSNTDQLRPEANAAPALALLRDRLLERSDRLSRAGLLTALAVSRFMDKAGGGAMPGTLRLAKVAGIAESTVKRGLRELREAGVMVRERATETNGRTHRTKRTLLAPPGTEPTKPKPKSPPKSKDFRPAKRIKSDTPKVSELIPSNVSDSIPRSIPVHLVQLSTPENTGAARRGALSPIQLEERRRAMLDLQRRHVLGELDEAEYETRRAALLRGAA